MLPQCSRTCGGGVQKRDVLCKQRMADGSFLELPETFCSASKPTSQQECKKDDCPSEWLLSDWSEVGVLLRRRERKSWEGREVTPNTCIEKRPKSSPNYGMAFLRISTTGCIMTRLWGPGLLWGHGLCSQPSPKK